MTSTNQKSESKANLLIAILSFGRPELCVNCVRSICEDPPDSTEIIICEQKSEEDALVIQQSIQKLTNLIPIEVRYNQQNLGYSAGHNSVIRPVLAERSNYNYFLLLNSDTLVRVGAISSLRRAAARCEDTGILGPRLEWPDGRLQVSNFRFPNPLTELVSAAGTSLITQVLSRFSVVVSADEGLNPPDWVSFAAVLIKREVLETVGLMDEGYFLYFEDVDYCRLASRHGWRIQYVPEAGVVHFRGQSSPVKRLRELRQRLPRYYYESRARYYRKYYGTTGFLAANLFWILGRSISWLRETLGGKTPHTCEKQILDIWTTSR